MATQIDSRLTHYIVASSGECGKGASIAEACAARPYSKGKSLPDNAVVYRVTPGTRVTELGSFGFPKGDPQPVRVDPKTGAVIDE